MKALRGGMTQEQLAEAAGVSVGVVRKLERGGTAPLPSLLSIADVLGTDIAVLLGQQAPRRSMDRDERAALRLVSAATHDVAVGLPAEVEPGTVEELRIVVRRADTTYWGGRYTELGTLLGRHLPEARARSLSRSWTISPVAPPVSRPSSVTLATSSRPSPSTPIAS
ncbi:helix-turn-helix domain-containing protein [Streptomyces sp. YPW6]|uniref:helix-turn-helix domain-containing protein n=1 Tax=Streptomyces sp. YPW6 TaxID=2840373 RepID=UPI00263A79A4|nr:helix-turn-helix transcriptional regulator [Streptomyces sp. YPW6]